MTCERLAIAAGLLLFVLSSYAWWGSPETPLASFWKGALLAAVLVAILRWGHWWALKKLLRMGRDHIREQRRLGLLARSSSESGVEIIRRRSE